MSESLELPDGEFDLIYADPPWRYRSNTTDPSREIENHYGTMDLDAIKSLDVPAADDSVLYLWATAPKLKEATGVVEAWGFDYRTCAVWDKMKLGLGYWFRINHELLLVGVKGSYPAPDDPRESIFREERGAHSEKPKKVRGHLEQAHPDARKLELFSRDGRVGWTMWGNETVNDPQELLVNYD